MVYTPITDKKTGNSTHSGEQTNAVLFTASSDVLFTFFINSLEGTTFNGVHFDNPISGPTWSEDLAEQRVSYFLKSGTSVYVTTWGVSASWDIDYTYMRVE